ncbi:hypothetical protein K443DRAFT_35586, partial [Laccaria amethystina LaAM-08-1]
SISYLSFPIYFRPELQPHSTECTFSVTLDMSKLCSFGKGGSKWGTRYIRPLQLDSDSLCPSQPEKVF